MIHRNESIRVNTPTGDAVGLSLSEIAMRESAHVGSSALLQSLNHWFKTLEKRHGLEAGEAQLLLLDTGICTGERAQ